MLEVNKIHCIDTLEGLKQLEDNSVDMIFTDPPWMISSEVRITRGRNTMKFKGKDLITDFGDWDWFKSLNHYFEWTFLWLDECIRVLKCGRIIAFYFDRDKINFASHYLQNKHNCKLKGYYADCKLDPVPQARKVKWMSGWEMVGMWQKPGGQLVYNYQLGQQKNYGVRPIVGGNERVEHPTQKPLSVTVLFIRYWSSIGDLIVDPFIGVGTTAVACKELHRNFIGFDNSPRYVEMANKRISKVQMAMFD